MDGIGRQDLVTPLVGSQKGICLQDSIPFGDGPAAFVCCRRQAPEIISAQEPVGGEKEDDDLCPGLVVAIYPGSSDLLKGCVFSASERVKEEECIAELDSGRKLQWHEVVPRWKSCEAHVPNSQ